MKKFISSKTGFFTVAVLLLWIKSYLVYLTEFNLDIQNGMQQFLLFINPISSALIFLGIALFARGKRLGIYLISIYTSMSVLLYANVVFYRFNTDFITLPVLTQTSNFGSIGTSVASLMNWTDLIYLLDVSILIILFIFSRKGWSDSRLNIRQPFIVLTAGVVMFTINLGLAEIDRPELLKRTFDRNYIVKYLGAYNFTIYDAILNVKTSTQRVLADSNDIIKVKEYTDQKYAAPDEELFGIARDKNIIKIHLESFQSFLIDFEVNGEEVTPFLNSLINDQRNNYTYYENFFHQTEQGKTADAELIVDNSLYGLPQGSAFVTKGKNTFQALPAVLGQNAGYTSAVFHGDAKSFWNRDEIYKEFGIDYYFYDDFYNMKEENVIGYGLKDKPFFKESMPILENLQEPFYAHLMSLTHHHPYLMDDEDITIEGTDTGDGSVDRYFQTARYLDEALEQFITDLKIAGLYEDSVIVLYGDHYGISENHLRALGEIFGEEITPYKYAELQRVPFLIKVPGMDGRGTVSDYAGQIDVMPTLLHLVGIDAKDYVQFGTDLFSEKHNETVAFRNGDFFTPNYAMVKGTFYNNLTGEEMEPDATLEHLRSTVENELSLSDQVLIGDLLRFYQPTEKWKVVDTSNYFYDAEQLFISDFQKEKWFSLEEETDVDELDAKFDELEGDEADPTERDPGVSEINSETNYPNTNR